MILFKERGKRVLSRGVLIVPTCVSIPHGLQACLFLVLLQWCVCSACTECRRLVEEVWTGA